MKTVYEASNTLEAHMIRNLIEQFGISAWVDGEYLQGGVGEIQAMGIVRVQVNDVDYQQASQVISDWEAEQPAATRSSEQRKKHRYSDFSLGLVIGFVLGALAFATLMRF